MSNRPPNADVRSRAGCLLNAGKQFKRPPRDSSGRALLKRAGERVTVVHRVLGRVLFCGWSSARTAGAAARAYPERLFLPELSWGDRTVERLDAIALSLAGYAIPIEILDGAGGEYELAHALGQRHTA